MKNSTASLTSFNFPIGKRLGKKYEIIDKLGHGWEGEVYLVRELLTGIDRAAKFFFPQRNKNNKTLVFYAKKLHELRHCPIVIQYLTQEVISIRGVDIAYLISDYIEGELLSEFLLRQPGHRLPAFQALHLLHALASGIENIHHMREFHGDLHIDNVIIRRFGLSFDLKLLDMFYWSGARNENIQYDVNNLIRIFYESIGGRKHYAKQPKEVKDICCGLKNSLIIKKFRSAGQLREYIETMEWN